MQKQWTLLNNTIPQTIEELIAILLKNRNISDQESFFSCSLNLINYEIGDMDKSVERIQKAIHQNEQIIVFGDYDADGLCSTTILWETLYALGANVRPNIPHREKEGYGLSQKALEFVISEFKPSLIITVDNGISAHKEVSFAIEKGIDVIITDHHTAPQTLPNTLIVHDHHVSGSAVAYKLSQKCIQAIQNRSENYQLPTDHLALVAIGTICDIIPLSIENRALVKHGIQQLRNTKRAGIVALCNIAGIQQNILDTYHIGYILGPRLNAQGRLDSAMNALRLLCARNTTQAIQLAQSINSINTERKSLTKEISEQAIVLAKKQQQEKILIVGSPQWNPGVIGLIASHLAKEFHKPAIVWGSSDEHPEIYKASARSIEGFHITDAIRHHKELLLSYGGHPMAAGLSINKQKLSEFSRSLNEYANLRINDELLVPKLIIDTEASHAHLTLTLQEKINQLSPFGAQHPEPVLKTSNYTIHEAKTIGKSQEHLKLKVSSDKNTKPIDAILWGKGSVFHELKEKITLAYKLEQNTWNEGANLQLNVIDYQLP